MQEAEVICVPDPEGKELWWSERVPQAIGLFVIALALVIAYQRHEFTSPNLALPILALITLPWVLDMLGWPHGIVRHETRFQYPLILLWTAVVLGGVYWLSISFKENIDFAPFFVALLIGEMAGTVGARFGAAVWTAGVSGLLILTYVNHFSGMVIWGFAFTIGWMGGVAYRRQLIAMTELGNAQSELAARAAEEERRRLAREIHDLIAHSLAVTMLQMSGARLALAAGDTEEALAALADAETAGRSAMAEIHRTVGLLGRDGEGAPAAPTPCAADVPELVDGFRTAGLDVTFHLDGDLAAVPMGTGLAAYRVVQESLSNAVKHAPGAPVDLEVRVTDGAVDVRVVNPIVPGAGAGAATVAASGGSGVRGMAERAELLGGTATARNGDGTWKVDARLPWSEAHT
jgi:signal transduction histidine kinase